MRLILRYRQYLNFYLICCNKLKRKELSGDLDLLRNSSYSCCEGGNILANFGPTEAKCSLKILDMRDESLETSLLFLKSLILILSLADFIMQNW